ncbi:electron transport complex subunit E [Ancylomarina sp. DW003]|uniref:Ion-translocating oxidoreductase complex subunit E n=1 Tax=Paralabilibaculum antarcticum TaxID=2912572 RepID=A0ABT5VQY9_9BACT|nr:MULTISPECIES: electron transport complex subunit E [Marinifilaceae]MDE5417836.1 electron transport complex subunit E [Labilibaculum sp. DW002]MDE5421320.1 electron transport complex subunit E [Ancylomarina sp. DW003]
MTNKENFLKGFFRENAVFTLLLGMCPALGVTSSAINGLGMGLATTFVLIMSNVFISIFSSFIPDKVKIPSFIVIIAAFVTMVDLIMAGYAPALHEQLGVFIPLIVVNCLVLGRAEAFASKNQIFPSIIDGVSMGLGFSMALTMLGAVRELFGAGKMFGITIFSENYGMLIFVLAPGAFIALGYLIAFINKLRKA